MERMNSCMLSSQGVSDLTGAIGRAVINDENLDGLI